MLTKIRHLRWAWHIIAPVGLLLVMSQCLGHAEGCRGEGNVLRMILYLSCQRSNPKNRGEPMASSIFQTGLGQSMMWELSKDIMALKEAFEEGNLPVVAAKLQATLRSLEDCEGGSSPDGMPKPPPSLYMPASKRTKVNSPHCYRRDSHWPRPKTETQ